MTWTLPDVDKALPTARFDGVPAPSRGTTFTAETATVMVAHGDAETQRAADLPVLIPDYLRDIYSWAYLNPVSQKFFDHSWVVSAILCGQYHRLQRAVFAELEPHQNVLQAACAYGDFSIALAQRVGRDGRLEVIDVAPNQVASCRRKLAGFAHADARLADAARPGGGPYDVICCFFLLHELPDDYKRKVVDALLASVVPGGKVVFIDYHKPHWAHPLKGVMSLVFDTLEPFAKALWRNEIWHFSGAAKGIDWRKETYFGGLYQKVVACKPKR